jgi:hypothetical protein
VPRLSRFAPALCVLGLVAGCANDNSDREQRIRDEAERQGRQEERLRQLENEVKEQRKGGSTTGVTTTTTPNTPASKQSGDCGGGIFTNSNTTCDFARNVASEYGKQSGAGVVSAYSPATGKTISMSCEGASPVVCTGGNDARVELR